jgi:hypothetical protein
MTSDEFLSNGWEKAASQTLRRADAAHLQDEG